MMSYDPTPTTWAAKTLLITDANLGNFAVQKLRVVCQDLTWICWDRSDPSSRKKVLEKIASETWELGISFYSDLILPVDLLNRIEFAVNIHPALPLVRGVGYDTIPLIENHDAHGATLHRIIEEIDRGEIFHVVENPLGQSATSSQLRRANQDLCLMQLELLTNWMLECSSVKSLERCLSMLGEQNHYQWSDDYISRPALTELLKSLQQVEPDHSVFK